MLVGATASRRDLNAVRRCVSYIEIREASAGASELALVDYLTIVPIAQAAVCLHVDRVVDGANRTVAHRHVEAIGVRACRR